MYSSSWSDDIGDMGSSGTSHGTGCALTVASLCPRLLPINTGKSVNTSLVSTGLKLLAAG